MTISRRRVPLGGRQAPLLSALVFLLAASQGVLRGQSAAELELFEKKIRPVLECTPRPVPERLGSARSPKGSPERNSDPELGKAIQVSTPWIASKLRSESHARSKPIVDATADVPQYPRLAAKTSSRNASGDKGIEAGFNPPSEMHSNVDGHHSVYAVLLYPSDFPTHRHVGSHRPATTDTVAEGALNRPLIAAYHRSGKSISMRLPIDALQGP